jgi:hypothetical protein
MVRGVLAFHRPYRASNAPARDTATFAHPSASVGIVVMSTEPGKNWATIMVTIPQMVFDVKKFLVIFPFFLESIVTLKSNVRLYC